MLSSIVKKIAFKTGRFQGLYIRLCRPSGYEYANYLKRWGGFYSIGNGCSIRPTTNITDPYLTKIGDNVQLSTCSLFGHDGSIACLNLAFDKTLDRVGKVEILDNVYIGHSAVVLPNVTIGPNALVAAGSIVTKSVPPDAIVAGNPAKVIGSVKTLVSKLEKNTDKYPWADIIKQRGVTGFNPDVEPVLQEMRIKYFFENDT